MDVSKPQEALTTDEFISSLMESPDQPEEEVTTAEDTAEEADQSDAEAEEAEEVTASDQSEEEPEEAEEEDAAAEAELYELDGVEFTLEQFKEWRADGLRNKDYTQKRQRDAEDRKAFDAMVVAKQAEFQKRESELEQQTAQLQDALATYAIAPVEEPNWAELKPEQLGPAMAKYQREQAQKEQAAAHHKALQQQQRQVVEQRETQALLQHFPQWSDPTVFQQDFAGMAMTAEEYGFSKDELAGTLDHRMYRVLNALRTAQAATDTTKAVTTKAEKKLVQAAKKVTPGVKGAQDRGAKKQRQQQMQRLKKTGSVDDFAELLMGGA
jgi:hypothetical protein